VISYPLDIELAHEFEGHLLVYIWSKGTYGAVEFCEAAMEHDDTLPELNPAWVTWGFLRKVPAYPGTNDGGYLLIDANGPGPGAFPVTLIDVEDLKIYGLWKAVDYYA
jgi:hypothetical protein